MRFLLPPERNAEADFRTVLAHRREPARGRLVAVEGEIYQAYFEYASDFDWRDPLTWTIEAASTARNLKENFRHTEYSRCLGGLRAFLFSLVGSGKCPYCELSEATVLDHFLPKARFPEFSVFASNLIPLCDECNRTKRDVVPQQVRYPHLFLDPEPAGVYLVAGVRLRTGLPVSYSLTWRERGASETAVENLFRDLNLLERYAAEASHELAGEIEPWRELVALIGPDRFVQHLSRCALSYARSLGANHWRPSLYRGLAEDEEFAWSKFWEFV